MLLLFKYKKIVEWLIKRNKWKIIQKAKFERYSVNKVKYILSSNNSMKFLF